MAIKFTGKDQPPAAPAANKASAKKIDREPAAVAAKDEAPDGSDLFSADAKRPVNRRKTK